MKIKLSSIKPFSNGRFPALLLAGMLYAVSLFALKELAEHLRPDNFIAIAVKNCFIAIMCLFLTERLGQFFICSTLSRFNKRPIFYTFIRSAFTNKRNWISVIFLLVIASSVVDNYMDNNSSKVINKDQQRTLTITQQSTALKSIEVINNKELQEVVIIDSRWTRISSRTLMFFTIYFMIFPYLHVLNILLLCNDLIEEPDSVDDNEWSTKLNYPYEYLISALKLAVSGKKFILCGVMSATLGTLIINIVLTTTNILNIDPTFSINLGLLFVFLQFAIITFISSTMIAALKLEKGAENKRDSSAYNM